MRRPPRENSALEIPEAREVLEKESEDHQLSRLVEAVQELPRNAIMRVIRAADGSLLFSSATFADLHREHVLREAARLVTRDVSGELGILTQVEALTEKFRSDLRNLIERTKASAAECVKEKWTKGDLILLLAEVIGEMKQLEALAYGRDDTHSQDDLHSRTFRSTRALLEILGQEGGGEITSMEEALAISSPLTLDHLVNYLKRSRATIYRLIEEDGLPAHRLPGRRGFLFYRDEVDAWVKRQGSGNEEEGSSAPDSRE